MSIIMSIILPWCTLSLHHHYIIPSPDPLETFPQGMEQEVCDDPLAQGASGGWATEVWSHL